eukprot:SAG31_NODE_258_length_18937_cov_61.688555_23_plen_106_part_00
MACTTRHMRKEGRHLSVIVRKMNDGDRRILRRQSKIFHRFFACHSIGEVRLDGGWLADFIQQKQLPRDLHSRRLNLPLSQIVRTEMTATDHADEAWHYDVGPNLV